MGTSPFLVLLLLASPGGLLQAEEPLAVTYRPVTPGEVPNLALKAVKRWAAGTDEAKEVEGGLRERENWSPPFMAAAGAASAVFGWRQTLELGGWKVRLAQHGLLGGTERLFSVGLGKTDEGCSTEASVGVRDNRIAPTVTVAYKLRY